MLQDFIKAKQAAFLRTLNGQLVTLFWETGRQKQLPATWRRKLSPSQLNAIQELPHVYPDLHEVCTVASLVSWQHILILVKQKNEESRNFYLWLTVEKNLSPNALRRQIAAKTFEAGKHVFKSYAKLSRIARHFDMLTIPAVFTGEQNKLLNAALNKTFWEIGKMINENPASLKQKSLTRFSLFHQQVPDYYSAMRLSHLLPFNYILAILPVQPLEAKLFYARIAATEGLTLAGLKKRISANEYQRTKGAKQREQKLIAQMNSPVSETMITQSRHSAEIITHVHVNYGNDADKTLLIKPISQNPYFTAFIK